MFKVFCITAYAGEFENGTILGYEGLNSGRVATRLYRLKTGTVTEYIDIDDFPESYKPTLREIFNKDIPTDMEKAREIKNLMYRYPFKVEGGIKDVNA